MSGGATAWIVHAGEYGPYRAKVVEVYDGDTVRLDLDLGFGFVLLAKTLWSGKTQTSCRVDGIDTPELNKPDQREAGLAARDYARTLLHPGDRVTVISRGWDKYGGRFDGVITLADGRDFAECMLATGHAVEYHGGTK